MDYHGVRITLQVARNLLTCLARYCSGGSCSDLVSLFTCWHSIRFLTPQQMKPGVFREEYIAIIVRELLKGLDYLHMEGKLHRDIKGSCFQHFFSFR